MTSLRNSLAPLTEKAVGYASAVLQALAQIGRAGLTGYGTGIPFPGDDTGLQR